MDPYKDRKQEWSDEYLLLAKVDNMDRFVKMAHSALNINDFDRDKLIKAPLRKQMTEADELADSLARKRELFIKPMYSKIFEI